MKTRKIYRFLLATLFFGFITACTKTEMRTNKLVKQGRWMVTELEIGTNSISVLPKWNLPTEPLDNQYATGMWTHADGSQVDFKWKFDQYDGTFTFIVDPALSPDSSEKAYVQCNNLAGTYTVLTDKKKLFEFESNSTNGYGTLPVYIKIEPL
ncbi:MAG: hypothetical protein HUJ25_03555 [Crocinitomicaceae bacterium]|nr:hypothetical protein [Crocinitomicaceae bacterium]